MMFTIFTAVWENRSVCIPIQRMQIFPSFMYAILIPSTDRLNRLARSTKILIILFFTCDIMTSFICWARLSIRFLMFWRLMVISIPCRCNAKMYGNKILLNAGYSTALRGSALTVINSIQAIQGPRNKIKHAVLSNYKSPVFQFICTWSYRDYKYLMAPDLSVYSYVQSGKQMWLNRSQPLNNAVNILLAIARITKLSIFGIIGKSMNIFHRTIPPWTFILFSDTATANFALLLTPISLYYCVKVGDTAAYVWRCALSFSHRNIR